MNQTLADQLEACLPAGGEPIAHPVAIPAALATELLVSLRTQEHITAHVG
jgi:hypothetical protein